MNPTLQLRSVQLRVSDLGRSVDFYTKKLGFHLANQSGSQVDLATIAHASPLLRLTEDVAAPAPPRDASGLFHVALRLPSRAALGRWLQETAQAGVEFDGFSDHGVSEALYLADPDGNGIEVYADRPPSAWVYHGGRLQMGTLPLALPDLLAAGVTRVERPLTGADWGHLHLRVAALDTSEAFYCSTLGMVTTVSLGSGARFLAADGYHHHLGLNTWGGVRQPQVPGRLGLIEAVFAHAGTTAEISRRDPNQIAIRIIPLEATDSAARP